MKLGELCRAGRSPEAPLSVQLPGGELLVSHWLRVLPGKRYVGKADWRGRQVLAKLLVGRRAERQFRRERDGAGYLAAQGVTTPALLESGYRRDSGGWLLFDFLEGAQSLGSAWCAVSHERPLSTTQREVLTAALEMLGGLHSKGLWQDDLHLDNLLCHDGRQYLVDGAGVLAERPGQPLSQERVLANLGIFFAQLPAAFDPFVEELLQHYLQATAAHGLSLLDLQREILRVRNWRLRDYLRKTDRDCSLFSVKRSPMGRCAVRREEAAALQELLEDPDRFVAEGRVYKTGGSSTVVRIAFAGRQLIVKRYNIKGWFHRLRRCWRPSRAWRSWREANRLDFLGIATPRPLAVVERRCCGLRGQAYLVTEFLEGDDILAHFEPFLAGSPPSAELAALEELFASLLRERISHGDMKGHNLFWHEGQWALIDLDAMRQHRTRQGFSRAFARDRKRFLNNWPADSALYRILDERLPRVPASTAR